ncbi:benenodin family lasso peptide [Sphingosinicella sp. LHD-64]|nr:benenodin family lasso peptide [Sphingosinicella sp. LHD-64]MDQ8757404.1 benenodin family lasso peptide [Sphingosinicella sp. LHD-64]
MNREHHNESLIELGAVSVETKGGFVTKEDQEGAKRAFPGLTDD